jgi:hypothetical protein
VDVVTRKVGAQVRTCGNLQVAGLAGTRSLEQREWPGVRGAQRSKLVGHGSREHHEIGLHVSEARAGGHDAPGTCPDMCAHLVRVQM